MKKGAADFLSYDSENQVYYLDNEQMVIDQVEKDHWKIVARTFIKDWRLYLMLVPMLLIFLFWRYFPMYELLVAFKAKGPSGVRVNELDFCGFDNFKTVLFGDYKTDFWMAFRNTFVLSFYGLLFGFPVPIILALFFNEIKSNGYRSVLQVLTYLPKFISTVIMTTLVWFLLSGTKIGEENPGILASFLEKLGMITPEEASTGMMYHSQYFRTVYIVSGIWEGAGYGSIVYFAAVIAISPTNYEAAQIDGAGKMAQMRYVVLPSILSTIVIMLIVRIGSLLSIGYEQVLLMRSNQTYVTAQVVSTYAIDLQLVSTSYATIPEFVNNITSMILVIGANAISRKATDTSLY